MPVRVNKLFYDVPDTVTSDAESRADGLTTLAKSVFPRFSHNFHVRVIPLIARFFFLNYLTFIVIYIFFLFTALKKDRI